MKNDMRKKLRSANMATYLAYIFFYTIFLSIDNSVFILSLIKFSVCSDAIMSVENRTEWNFGEEYVYEFWKYSVILMGHDKKIVDKRTATVTCRPTVSSQRAQHYLVCHARKIVATIGNTWSSIGM